MANPNLPSWAQHSGSSRTSTRRNPNLPSWAGNKPSASTDDGGDVVVVAKKKGGGFLHHLGSAISGGAHWTAKKAEIAGRDIEGFPTGVYEAGKATAPGLIYNMTVHGESPSEFFHKNTVPFAKGVANSTATTAKHPLRDPFATALLVAPAVGAAGRLGLAANVARTGDIAGAAKTLVTRPKPQPRAIHVPKHTVDKETGAVTESSSTVHLHSSRGSAAQLVQKAHDAVIQKALNSEARAAAAGREPGRVTARIAKYGHARVGGSVEESARTGERMGATKPTGIERSAKTAHDELSKDLIGLATRLTSNNNTAEEAIAAAQRDIAAGHGVEANTKLLAGFQNLANLKVIVKDAKGNAIINSARYPKLAALDARIAAGQDEIDQIAVKHGLMTEEDLATARNGPARIRAGGHYEKPTPGKLGLETPGLKASRKRVVSLQGRLDRADQADQFARDQGLGSAFDLKGPMRFWARDPRQKAQLRGAIAEAERDQARNERAAAKRIQPTGVVGGETAREGRGFVSDRASVPNRRGGILGRKRGPVIGEQRSFIPAHARTYAAQQSGEIPIDTPALVAEHYRDALRYVNTEKRLATSLKTGSDIRRNDQDVLVRDPSVPADHIPTEVKQELGTERSTLEGTNDEKYQSHLRGLIPSLDRLQRVIRGSVDERPVGTVAPTGYKWVNRKMLRELVQQTAPRSGLGHAADTINSAVTFGTVYTKPGHLTTRGFTNAFTSLIQGSAHPSAIVRSFNLWKHLSEDEKWQALAASGQHGISALPHEGSNFVGRSATRGANWWAHHVDAPFRFNNLAYEARKAGIKTPDEFRQFLHDLQHQDGLSASRVAKIDWIQKRADRASIMYDGLSPAEKRVLTRVIWFYPWIKGSVRFSGHIVSEHPGKAAAIGALGVAGRKRNLDVLGLLPTHQAGLTPLRGGSRPLVADFSTFTPLSTTADMLNLVARPGEIIGQANPAYGALTTLVTGVNSYGNRTNSPVGDALSELFAPTPEAQILSAAMHRPKPTQIFRRTPASQAERAIFGPWFPRRANKPAFRAGYFSELRGR